MNLNEYKEKIRCIDKQYEVEKFKAAKEYALSNSIVKIDDLIEDHMGKIIVDKIMIYCSNPPQCVYEGIECKKDGTRSKRGKKRSVFQSNMVHKE